MAKQRAKSKAKTIEVNVTEPRDVDPPQQAIKKLKAGTGLGRAEEASDRGDHHQEKDNDGRNTESEVCLFNAVPCLVRHWGLSNASFGNGKRRASLLRISPQRMWISKAYPIAMLVPRDCAMQIAANRVLEA